MFRKKPTDKRRYPRIEAKIKVSFPTLEDLRVEYTRNISVGGIFLKTDQLLDPNAEIALTLSFPEKLGTVDITGKVARLMSLTHPSDPDKQLYGVGIRFVNMDPAVMEQIEQAISNLPASAMHPGMEAS
jgi:uncharacterized protein (TIGR02266 family)